VIRQSHGSKVSSLRSYHSITAPLTVRIRKRIDFMASHCAHHYPTTSFHNLHISVSHKQLTSCKTYKTSVSTAQLSGALPKSACNSQSSNQKDKSCPQTHSLLATNLQFELQALSSDQSKEPPTAHHLISLCAHSPCAIIASWCNVTSAHETRTANWALERTAVFEKVTAVRRLASQDTLVWRGPRL
jgi:hypothetical protein